MTERRTGEIGIRMALGACRGNIALLVSVENSVITFSGCIVGLAASLMASKLVASFLFGIRPQDPLAFAMAVVALLFVAVLASLLPAIRATRLDPMSAIRCE
jgi:ABC-type antimicrobial peptide transport system permease subunit